MPAIDSFQIPGIIAAVSSFSVVLTCIVFSDLRRLRYIQLVFCVAINDCVASIGVSFGFVPSGSPACWFQALVTSANYIAACFWTVVIAYQLWLVVHHGKTIKDMRLIHLFCWCFPWVVSFLPLTTNTYGKDDNSWCFVENRPNSPSWGQLFWEISSFYVWIFGSILIMIGLLVSVFGRLRSFGNELAMSSLTKLWLYPVFMTICWVPSFVSLFVQTKSALLLGNIFPILQGIIGPAIFFSQNQIVRRKWGRLLRQFSVLICCKTKTDPKDIEVDISVELESDYVANDNRFSINTPVNDTLTQPSPFRVSLRLLRLNQSKAMSPDGDAFGNPLHDDMSFQ